MRTAALALVLGLAAGQQPTPPTNDAPNPYKLAEGWAKMPEGRTWGATSAVEIDKDGTSIWAGDRCGQNDCVGSTLDPILKFDANGTLVKGFGAGLVLSPHGIHVDRDNNVWMVDCACTGKSRQFANENKKGHQVFKFSPDGKLLLTLGAAGGGTGSEGFTQPNDVVTDTNGDIYVAEGHGGANARIVVFDRNGKYLREFGKKGAGPGEFDQPHGLAFDSRGRLLVADRSNNRIQVVDKNGTFIEEWKQYSRPSGIYVRGDMIYVADSESGTIDPSRPEWHRGIRIGSMKDGKVIAFIPDAAPVRGTSGPEGVAADAAGNVYGAEVGQRALKRYVKAAR